MENERKHRPALDAVVLAALSVLLVSCAGDTRTDQLCHAAAAGKDEAVVRLISSGVDINAKDSISGECALVVAVKHGQIKTVELLIQHNADVNARVGSSGPTALMLAARDDYLGIAELLINSRAQVNWQDANNASALIYAAMKGHANVVEMLLRNGADIDRDGSLAMSVAKAGSFTNVVKLLVQSGVKEAGHVNNVGKGISPMDLRKQP